MKSLDSHGIPVEIGDTIVYHHSNSRGNTALKKAEIVSFTNSGKPKIASTKAYWDTPDRRWVRGAELAHEYHEQTLMCNFAKGHKL